MSENDIFEDKWPFKNMAVFDIEQITGSPEHRRKAQIYAHAYAKKNGSKKFMTRTVGDILYVKRVK